MSWRLGEAILPIGVVNGPPTQERAVSGALFLVFRFEPPAAWLNFETQNPICAVLIVASEIDAWRGYD